jgi:hypothetical protein
VAKAFRRRRDGTITAGLHADEAELLRSLVGQLLELLADGQARPVDSEDPFASVLDLASPEPPEDPVLHRLFPDAYGQDREAAADFRRYTERGLRDRKRRGAEVVLASLTSAGEGGRQRTRVLTLDDEEADAWMRTLTDLRLALGTRLGVEEGDEERWASLPVDDPARYVRQIFDWLGWLQETLVEARTAAL